MTSATGSSRVRVLLAHVVDAPDQLAGAEEIVLQLATFLAALPGIEVAAAVNEGRLLDALRGVGAVDVYRLPPRTTPLALARALRSAVRRAAPDVISSHHRLSTWLTTARRVGGAPVCHTVHVLPTRRRRLSRWGDFTVCVSEGIRRELLAARLIDPERSRVIVNGIGDHGVRRRSARDGAPFRLATIGRLTEQKGQRVLLDAARRLGDAAGVELWIVGDGPDRGAIEAEASQPFVRVLGTRPRDEALGAVDGVVMPSLWEGTPLVLLEAWCGGLPVIASRIPGIEEYARDGEALLVPAGDPDALANAIERLRDDAELSASLGAAGRRAYERHFTLERMAYEYADLFTRLASGAKVPS